MWFFFRSRIFPKKVFSDLGLTSSSVQSRSAAWKSLYFEGITLRKTGLGSRALKTLQLHPMCAFSQYKNICSGYESAGWMRPSYWRCGGAHWRTCLHKFFSANDDRIHRNHRIHLWKYQVLSMPVTPESFTLHYFSIPYASYFRLLAATTNLPFFVW